MDIPTATLEDLKCSSCSVYLSRGPVYLQHDGAAVCGRCYTPRRPATRNKQYEATAKLLKFPCKNRELGCSVTVPYVEQDEEIAHEEVCEHRQYVCPVQSSDRCDWLGPWAAMLAHCRAQHPGSVLGNPCNLTHDISRASLQNYIISAFQVLFLLHTKVCLVTGKIFHAVRLLGGADEATNYHFTLDIKRNDMSFSKPGRVAPQGCLAVQEDISLGMNTNSLLDMLGGFNGTTFTVTVKRRVSDAAQQLARAVEKCAECGVELTVFWYRGEGGWRCRRCAPTRRACENMAQGCTHADINSKSWKHELFFCQKCTFCNICCEFMPRGSLTAHYASVHQDITYSAGSTWRATANGKHHSLVSSVAGTAVCKYDLTDSYFGLSVHTPVSSERLSKFRCEVRVTDPATGHARTFTPDTLYDWEYDWFISLVKEELHPQSWNSFLDVIVNIFKI